MYGVCVSCMSTFHPWDRELTCPSCQPRFRPRRRVVPTVPFDCTDGGRKADGFQSETNDCTVRAVAIATDSSYAAAHTWLHKAGRKFGQGCHWKRIASQQGHQMLGFRLEQYRLPERSKGVRTAIARNPQLAVGTWIIHSTQHVAVLRDGKLLDSFDSSRKVIDMAWRVVPATETGETK